MDQPTKFEDDSVTFIAFRNLLCWRPKAFRLGTALLVATLLNAWQAWFEQGN
jgi:hypothetical protein